MVNKQRKRMTIYKSRLLYTILQVSTNANTNGMWIYVYWRVTLQLETWIVLICQESVQWVT